MLAHSTDFVQNNWNDRLLTGKKKYRISDCSKQCVRGRNFINYRETEFFDPIYNERFSVSWPPMFRQIETIITNENFLFECV